LNPILKPLEQLQQMQQRPQPQPIVINTNPRARPNQYEPSFVQIPVIDNRIPQLANLNVQHLNDKDVKEIKDMFPTFDEDIIRSVLESNNGDKELAINILLQMTTD
jgi:hypothetical protein